MEELLNQINQKLDKLLQAQDEKLLTAQEAAVYLNCHEVTIYKNKKKYKGEIFPGVGLRFRKENLIK